jgi:hypothetical protein
MTCQSCQKGGAAWIVECQTDGWNEEPGTYKRNYCIYCTSSELFDYQTNLICEFQDYNVSSVIQCLTCQTTTDTVVRIFDNCDGRCFTCNPLENKTHQHKCEGECQKDATHNYLEARLCKLHLHSAMGPAFNPDLDSDDDQVVYPIVVCLYCNRVHLYTSYPTDVSDIVCGCE